MMQNDIQLSGKTLEQCQYNLELFAASWGHLVATKTIEQYQNPPKGDKNPGSLEHEKAANTAENLLTTALSILQNHGIYAMFLWLNVQGQKKKDKIAAPEAVLYLVQSAHKLHPTLSDEPGNILSNLLNGDLLTDMTPMFFVKDTLEQILIYARYHAKAEGATQ